MEEERRVALFEDAISRPFAASSFEVLLAVVLSWAAGAGVVALLAWWLPKPLIEAPTAYAIVFASVALTFAFTLGAAFVGQQLGDLSRAARAIALSQPQR